MLYRSSFLKQWGFNVEQVSLLAAADFWRTKGIPSKNIPAVKTSDGPNGARGGIFVGGTKVSFGREVPSGRLPC